MSADFGPCSSWPVRWLTDVSTESPIVTAAAVAAATDIVWALSGRRFGTCSFKLRPCRRSCLDTPFPDGWTSWPGTIAPPLGAGGGWGGWWFPSVCGNCASSTSCACGALPEINLPAPVSSVTEVRVDGSVLVTGAYHVDDNRKLVRLDGKSWPICNDLAHDDTGVGSWSVTVVVGEDVPDSGAFAIGEMAGEYLKATHGEDCRLPRNISSLVRQGVTISMPMLSDLLKEGRTGMPLVDLFIAATNPHHLPSRSRVYSVDNAAARRVGT